MDVPSNTVHGRNNSHWGGRECSGNATTFFTFNRNILIIITYVAVKMVHAPLNTTSGINYKNEVS